MKIIKPIVAISKIIDNHDAVLCGFDGVLYDGKNVNKEALHALHKCSEAGKEVVVLTNSPLRVHSIIGLLLEGSASDLAFLSSVISAGEVLHYRLKDYTRLGLPGPKYYTLGNTSAEAVFAGTLCQCRRKPKLTTPRSSLRPRAGRPSHWPSEHTMRRRWP